MAKAKKKRPMPAKRPDAAEMAEKMGQMQQPPVNWRVIAQIGLGFAVVWVLAGMTFPYIGWWGVGGAAVLTLVALGFAGYLWNMRRKSTQIFDILKGATSEEGRKEALAKLEASGGKNDAMNAIARANLAAQDDPKEAMRILEEIDIDKAPAMVRDEVRANLALLYLSNNKPKDARPLVDEIKLDRQPAAKSRALYAAVMSETFARTGKAADGKKLLQDVDVNDPELSDVKPLILRAQVYTYTATKNRGLATKAMTAMAEHDPNMLAIFLRKGARPEHQQLAKKLLGQLGMGPKTKFRYR